MEDRRMCHGKPFLLRRRVKEAADLHNMSWRVRPEEVLLEVGKTFSSRLGLQKNSEVSAGCLLHFDEMTHRLTMFRRIRGEILVSRQSVSLPLDVRAGSREAALPPLLRRVRRVAAAGASVYHHRHLQGGDAARRLSHRVTVPWPESRIPQQGRGRGRPQGASGRPPRTSHPPPPPRPARHGPTPGSVAPQAGRQAQL